MVETVSLSPLLIKLLHAVTVAIAKAAAAAGLSSLKQRRLEKAVSEAVRAELMDQPDALDKLEAALGNAEKHGLPAPRIARAKDLLEESSRRKKAAKKAAPKKVAAKKPAAKKAAVKKAALKKVAAKKPAAKKAAKK
jgi:hypothetical protein